MSEKKRKKINKHFLLGISYLLLVTICSGCATVATKQALPSYNINAVTYVPLVTLCGQRGVKLDYDSFTKTVTLTRGARKVNLMAGESIVIVDGAPEHLKHRVDFYHGTIVVPKAFIEQVMDVVFFDRAEAPENAVSYVRNIKTIVVDAGHGGRDPGAIGKSGLREKNINLDIANRLGKILKDAGIKVIMTRSSDYFVPLEKRVEIANNANPELFISIHTNANHARQMNGFEVYHVSTDISDLKRAQFSADNAVLDLDRSTYGQLTSNLKTILWDMIYASSRAESVDLARSICRTVNNDLSVKVIGIKSAGFHVLRGTHMPAVLVEIGFISNASEELKLKNNYYRQQIAGAIAQGVKNYAHSGAFAEAVKQ